MKTFPHIGV